MAEPPNESSNVKVENWAALIPEVYFDLISRFPPGILLITLLIFCLYRKSPDSFNASAHYLLDAKWGAATSLVLLLLFASHTIGILLTAPGALVHRLYRRIIWIHIARNNSTDLDAINSQLLLGLPEKQQKVNVDSLGVADIERLERRLHVHLKERSASAASLLPKFRAETSLCDNLFAALLIFGIVFASFRIDLNTFWELIYLLALLLTGSAAPYRYSRLLHRYFAYWAASRR